MEEEVKTVGEEEEVEGGVMEEGGETKERRGIKEVKTR